MSAPARRASRSARLGSCGAGVGPEDETCKGVDDDCNGEVDDAPGDVGEPCGTDVGECVAGTTVCQAGEVVCSGRVVPVDEECNDLDDDCDGLADFSITGNGIVGVCEMDCQPVRLPVNAGREYPEGAVDPNANDDLPAVECTPQADGTLSMAFSYHCPPDGPWPYRACEFSVGQDLSVFDADNGGDGALEIVLSADRAMLGGLNLWYGFDPHRKLLKMVESGIVLEPGETTWYFAPVDAECQWSLPGWGHIWPGCADTCNLGQEGCTVDYSDTQLALIAEFCAADTGAALEVHSVTYYPPGCRCLRDAACTDPERPVCNTAAALPDERCPPENPRCAGVCVASVADCDGADWLGEACEALVDGRACAGRWVCSEGEPACRVPPDAPECRP